MVKPEIRSRMVSHKNSLKRRATPSEVRILRMLKEKNARFIFQKAIFTKTSYFITDFYFPKPLRIVLEVDGGYHANTVEYDASRTEWLKANRKIKVIRITNDQADSITAEELQALIPFQTKSPQK